VSKSLRDPREAALGQFDQRLRFSPEQFGLLEAGGAHLEGGEGV